MVRNYVTRFRGSERRRKGSAKRSNAESKSCSAFVKSRPPRSHVASYRPKMCLLPFLMIFRNFPGPLFPRWRRR